MQTLAKKYASDPKFGMSYVFLCKYMVFVENRMMQNIFCIMVYICQILIIPHVLGWGLSTQVMHYIFGAVPMFIQACHSPRSQMCGFPNSPFVPTHGNRWSVPSIQSDNIVHLHWKLVYCTLPAFTPMGQSIFTLAFFVWMHCSVHVCTCIHVVHWCVASFSCQTLIQKLLDPSTSNLVCNTPIWQTEAFRLWGGHFQKCAGFPDLCCQKRWPIKAPLCVLNSQSVHKVFQLRLLLSHLC